MAPDRLSILLVINHVNVQDLIHLLILLNQLLVPSNVLMDKVLSGRNVFQRVKEFNVQLEIHHSLVLLQFEVGPIATIMEFENGLHVTHLAQLSAALHEMLYTKMHLAAKEEHFVAMETTDIKANAPLHVQPLLVQQEIAPTIV